MPHPSALYERPVLRGGLPSLVILSMSVLPGCTSALTTAYLKGTPWNLSEPAGDDRDSEAAAAADTAETSAEPPTEDTLSPEAREAARADAVERAVASLAAVGSVDAATEAALVALLQRTDQEDWPAVVDEFVAALSASPQIVAKPVVDDVIPVAIAADAELPAADPPPTAPEPPGEPAAADQAAARTAEANAPATVPATAASDPAAAGEPVSVHNACFASRVQAWGVVERFAADRFRPGQDVIVYFELEQLASERTPDGHTTCIDTALALVTVDGDRIHDWSFDPIRETCPGRRRDYFARYVVRIPETAPVGPCRLEIAVADAIAGGTAAATLPLEIVAD